MSLMRFELTTLGWLKRLPKVSKCHIRPMLHQAKLQAHLKIWSFCSFKSVSKKDFYSLKDSFWRC